jgi:hypothetical protein
MLFPDHAPLSSPCKAEDASVYAAQQQIWTFPRRPLMWQAAIQFDHSIDRSPA